MLSEAKHPVNSAEMGAESFAEFALSDTNGIRTTVLKGPLGPSCHASSAAADFFLFGTAKQ